MYYYILLCGGHSRKRAWRLYNDVFTYIKKGTSILNSYYTSLKAHDPESYVRAYGVYSI